MPNLTPTPPEQLAQALEPVDAIISEVASLVGQPDDARVREEALACIQRAAARLNGKGVWFSSRATGAWVLAENPSQWSEFADGADSLALPDDWAWPGMGAAVYDSEGNVVSRPAWASWHVYREYATRNDSGGVPEILAMESSEAGEVRVWPPVRGASVSRIELPYYRRIANLGSEDSLYLIPEVREALVAGGEYFLVKRRFRQDTNIVGTFWRDWKEAEALALAADRRLEQVLNGQIIPLEVSRAPVSGTRRNCVRL